jgi:hypothetical protein
MRNINQELALVLENISLAAVNETGQKGHITMFWLGSLPIGFRRAIKLVEEEGLIKHLSINYRDDVQCTSVKVDFYMTKEFKTMMDFQRL